MEQSVMKNKKISKILIVNRSEIAVRIQATCRALGIKTVALCSSEDAESSYVYQADQAYSLSQQGFQAYLDQDEIIAIAQKARVAAIHPGYGFLSENPTFAQRVIDAGLLWIGPDPEHIRLMGDKVQARKLLEKVGIAVVPGHHIASINETTRCNAKKVAQKIGYPVILKDPLSGGGKAMKRVNSVEDFDEAWDSVVRESMQLTGSGQLLLEKYVQHARHIEVQIASDGKNTIHLFERECSIQRRHQKIIEEAPCIFVDHNVLKAMYDTAITVAQTIGYKNIGTVEFLVTPDGNFYFLEMNTRLQVEHSVTEFITGVDLVQLQLDIAQRGSLPFTQDDIKKRGHAIECRIYSEDPAHNFFPSSGIIRPLKLPHGPFRRHDHDLYQGKAITPFFDPMISKVTTYGITRESAISVMHDALKQFFISGLKTNISFLQQMICTREFITGAIHTQLLSNKAYLNAVLNHVIESPGETDEELSPAECAALAGALTEVLQQQITAAYKAPERRVPQSRKTTNQWKAQQWH